ncbi:uncharacterized protein LOC134464026 [Engraulis encrasicolus]|uniref:uncharacterized protein LOC134464026 n=1 Tax=Engraulis encrasicolus TaxID=184585 RepID=UPI002FD47C29
MDIATLLTFFLLCISSATAHNDKEQAAQPDGYLSTRTCEGTQDTSSSDTCSIEKSHGDNIYLSLWEKSLDQAYQTLNLDFIQHMEAGDLPVDRYVNFTIQDIYYLVKVTDMLKNMSTSVKKPEDLRQFFQGRYSSYKRFQDHLLSIFYRKGVSDIKPTPAMRKYVSDYETIMRTKEPIYFAVSLLPCSRLWVWLANKVDMAPSNAYYAWKKDNMGGRPEKHYETLLNKYLTLNNTEAYHIFRTQMQNEHDFFATS